MSDIGLPAVVPQPQVVRRFRINTEDEATARQTFVAGMQANNLDASCIVADAEGNPQNDMSIGGIAVHWLGKQPRPAATDADPDPAPYAGMHVDILDAAHVIDISLFTNTDEVTPATPYHTFL